ncbi:centromere protein F-like [Pteronotus mesoamericanus]|uniref:centromere protein F-like n=1 Tax=Pteronotus mesoamericanus TaxID=1884717 RepID=UPI0023EB72B9|nr:centromere protein F-like [Pteronotus parnellii mesoamericanus]
MVTVAGQLCSPWALDPRKREDRLKSGAAVKGRTPSLAVGEGELTSGAWTQADAVSLRELSRQERAFQSLERESAQAKGRLSEELRRVRAALGALQEQLEEVSSGKQQVEKKLEGCKQRCGRTKQALQASQTRKEELRRSSEEMKKEIRFLKRQSAQRAREVCHLQEELQKSKRGLSESQNVAKEMRGK